jgi:hypothetical protein
MRAPGAGGNMSQLSLRGQALVSSARDAAQPTAVDQARVLAALRSSLGEAALPLEAQAATAAVRSIWPLLSGLVVGAGVLGATMLLPGRPASTTAGPSVAQLAPSLAPTSQPPFLLGTPLEAEPPPGVDTMPSSSTLPQPSAERAAVPKGPSRHAAQDRLAAEVAILSRALGELRAGQPTSALAALNEHRRKFPAGALVQERRAAEVHALCALERFQEANLALVALARQSPAAAAAAGQACRGNPTTSH